MRAVTVKPVDRLTSADLSLHPVWEYVLDETVGVDETTVAPVWTLPVDSLENRVAGIEIELANGNKMCGLISCVSLRNLRSTKHFVTLSVERDGVWFHLARYFDVEYDKYGPYQLAEFLELPVNDVFPIRYDLSAVVRADAEFLRGSIPMEPIERLSEAELIALALEDDEE